MASVIAIRRVRAATVLLFVLAVPAVLGAAVLALKLAGTYLPALLLGAVWMLSFAVSATTLALLKCPQCGQRFIRFNWFFPRVCARCGFRC
jgi:undecaprenyl pyrophosphate phosphatase UppP